MKEINILGEKWRIEEHAIGDDNRLSDCSGYTDWTSKLIVVIKDFESNFDNKQEFVKKVLRHEIVHAFLFESGLDECSSSADSWATNEEMVDWIARKGITIYKAWSDAGAL